MLVVCIKFRFAFCDLVYDVCFTIIREELTKPLGAGTEVFGLAPILGEKDIKEANNILVDAIVWGLLPSYMMENPFLRQFVEKVSRGSFILAA